MQMKKLKTSYIMLGNIEIIVIKNDTSVYLI